METRGKHLLLDVWLKERFLDNAEMSGKVARVTDYIEERFTVVGRAQHVFEPQGLTSVLILSESHFTIHTYPEHGFLSMDLYVCSPSVDLEQVCTEILALFSHEKASARVISRGRVDRKQPKKLKSSLERNPAPCWF